MTTIHHRRDWPAGSNARLVAEQNRTSTGYTAIATRSATGPSLADMRYRPAPRAIRPTPPAPAVAPLVKPEDEIDSAVLGTLLQLAAEWAFLLANRSLGIRCGLSGADVTRALDRLHARGEIVLADRNRDRRTIDLPSVGVRLRQAAPPEMIQGVKP